MNTIVGRDNRQTFWSTLFDLNGVSEFRSALLALRLASADDDGELFSFRASEEFLVFASLE